MRKRPIKIRLVNIIPSHKIRAFLKDSIFYKTINAEGREKMEDDIIKLRQEVVLARERASYRKVEHLEDVIKQKEATLMAFDRRAQPSFFVKYILAPLIVSIVSFVFGLYIQKLFGLV